MSITNAVRPLEIPAPTQRDNHRLLHYGRPLLRFPIEEQIAVARAYAAGRFGRNIPVHAFTETEKCLGKPLSERHTGGLFREALRPGFHVIVADLMSVFNRGDDITATLATWASLPVTVHVCPAADRPAMELTPELIPEAVRIISHVYDAFQIDVHKRSGATRRKRRAAGRACGGRPPMGMTNNRGKLIPHKRERQNLAIILWLTEHGFSLDKIFFGFCKLKVKSARGLEWSRSRIHEGVAVARELRETGELPDIDRTNPIFILLNPTKVE